jgi:hypothetical protein
LYIHVLLLLKKREKKRKENLMYTLGISGVLKGDIEGSVRVGPLAFGGED